MLTGQIGLIEGQKSKIIIFAGIASYMAGVLNFNLFDPMIFAIGIFAGTFLAIDGFLGIMGMFSARPNLMTALSVLFIFASGACFAGALVVPLFNVGVQMTYAYRCFGFHPGQFIYIFTLAPAFLPLIVAGATLCTTGVAMMILYRV